jgi:signal transduction histidine kinase
MRLRPSTAALLVVIVFVLGGLATAERAFVMADRLHVQGEAQQGAERVRSYFALHDAALGALQGLLVLPDAPAVDSLRFASLIDGAREHAPGLRRVWIASASGRVLHDVLLDGTPRPVSAAARPALGPGTIAGLREAARVARRPRISSLGTLHTGERGVALVKPVFVGTRFVGIVGGTIAVDGLGTLLPPDPGDPAAAFLEAGRDTLALTARRAPAGDWLTAGPLAGGTLAQREVVRLPGGQRWALTVTHAARGRALRVSLWGAGVCVLVALALGLLHERRQARRIADRSSELERLSDELLRANKAKSEFLANVSHELRTPLNAIVGFTELLREGVYGELGPRQAGPVQRIEASAGHLRHLVDQVLDLAKMAAGRLEVHPELINLRPFVLDIAGEVESLVNEKGLSLSIAVGASLPRVRTDPQHLRQILVNLLGNAVKYTEVGGVAVRGRLVGPPSLLPRGPRPTGDTGSYFIGKAPSRDRVWVALQVVDSGVGIAEADRDRIFDEFEQVNAGPRGDSMRRGTGLGLSISRRLARLLGGDITVESAPGKGSSFTLWLPASVEHRVPDEAPAAALLATSGR